MNKKTALSKPGKEKRRNSDKRKEKSRDAARCRRTRETEIFNDLASALPLSASSISQLDKASIMRLAISYLRVRQLMSVVPAQPSAVTTPKPDCSNDQLFLRALQGFLLVISADGDFVFLSENIQDYIGIPQMELMGHSIYEYSHPCDHDEIREILSVKAPRVPTLPCSFFIRLKSTITSQGRSVNLKSASYKVIHCTGHVLGGGGGVAKATAKYKTEEAESESDDEASRSSPLPPPPEPQHCLVAIGEPIPHPSNIEIPLDKQTFLSKHSLDMKFTYADDKIGDFLGYNSTDLLGKSVYEYYHAMDSSVVERGFKSLFAKGQCETGRYRFLAKNGGYVWVLTQATLIYGNKGQKPQSVVCVNFVISGIEHRDEIYSCMQLTSSCTTTTTTTSTSRSSTSNKSGRSPQQPGVEHAPPAPVSPPFYTRPTVVTAKLIAPAPATSRPQAVTAKLFPLAPISTAAPHVAGASNNTSNNNSNNHSNINSNSNSYPHSVTAKLFHSAAAAAAAAAPAPGGGQWHRPQATTAKIFAPRTEDMNKGFLMFADDDTGRITMLKDEPDDLTHLAPTAGDVCVPLENNPFMADMFDDFILGDNYCPLMADEMIALSHSPASDDVGAKENSDPFFSYRDDSSSSMMGSPGGNDLSGSSQLLSSSSLKKLVPSPEDCSLPSLCSPESTEQLMSLSVDTDGDEELSMRAPYIPMCEGDDLPLLMSADLMWGPLPPDAEDAKSGRQTGGGSKNNSSLEELLRDEATSVLPATSPQPIKSKDLVDPTDVLNQIYVKNCDGDPADWPPSLLSDPLPTERTKPAQRVSPITLKRSHVTDYSADCDRASKRASGLPSPTKRSKDEPPPECSQLMRHLTQPSNPAVNRAKAAPSAAAVLTQPSPPQSDSVLMNLLVSGCDEGVSGSTGVKRKFSQLELSDVKPGTPLSPDSERRQRLRKKSFSLLDPSASSILSLFDLSQQDYDVNAPLGNRRHLLQGRDLLTALETSSHALLE